MRKSAGVLCGIFTSVALPVGLFVTIGNATAPNIEPTFLMNSLLCLGAGVGGAIASFALLKPSPQ